MLPMRKTMSLKILTSKPSHSKLSISERKDQSGCGFSLVFSPLHFFHANSSSKAGLMRTTTDIKGRHHLCTLTRMILQTLKISSFSRPQNTMNGGMLVYSKDRTFLFNFRYMKIQDGKKIYFKHAGVNQPGEVPEIE